MSVIKITKDNYKSEVEESKTPVLLDFWASWCGPCRMMSPIIDGIADDIEEKGSNIKVGKVSIDEEPELAQKFGVMSIPTVIQIKNGEITDTLVGLRSKEAILDILK